MKAFISGMVIGLVLVAAGVYVYFVTGMAPVAAAAEAMPFEKMLAHRALNARIEKEAPRNVPVAADESNFVAGAQVYRDQCAICHGLPGQQPSVIAKGMFPHPPELFHGKGVTDDEPGETYWKVANGIRLTGMPAFNRSLTETQIWQVSLLVANADKLPDSVMKLLSDATAGSQRASTIGNFEADPLTWAESTKSLVLGPLSIVCAVQRDIIN